MARRCNPQHAACSIQRAEVQSEATAARATVQRASTRTAPICNCQTTRSSKCAPNIISFDDRRNNSISPAHRPPEAPRSRVSCDVAVAAAADWLSILMQRRMLSHCWLHFLMCGSSLPVESVTRWRKLTHSASRDGTVTAAARAAGAPGGGGECRRSRVPPASLRALQHTPARLGYS